MVEAFLGGLSSVMDGGILLVVLISVLVGLFVGLLPGLGGLASIALLLPFVWQLPPKMGMAMLLSLLSVVFTSGSITAILLNIPGESSNICTTIDGYRMTQQGKGGIALGLALTGSMLGGILAVGLAFIMLPLIVPVVMNFKFAETFLVTILGFSFLSVVGSESTLKNLISGGLGVLIGLIGYHSTTGISRYTFDSAFLYGGVSIGVFIMGIFGLGEMFDLMAKGQTSISHSQEKVRLKDVFGGSMTVLRKWPLFLRSTILGYFIGVIPGMGSISAAWIAYGQAKQISKSREKFGTGYEDGVIAPESADNASVAGSLLTTLAFGIPGSGAMAVILGALFMVGVQPGPMAIQQNLDLIFFLLIIVALANLIGGLICYLAASHLAKLATIHLDYVFPVVIVSIFIAAYAAQSAVLDFWVVILAGLIGFIMKQFGFSLASLCLGFVLGKMMEYYFFASLKLLGPFFFLTPICIVLMTIIVGLYTHRYIIKGFRKLFRSGN